MKKRRFGRLTLFLLVAVLLACGGFWLSFYLHENEDMAASLSGAPAPSANAGAERGFALPAAPKGMADMSAAQKREAAMQAEQDAEAAALAAGQSAAEAQEAKTAARAVAERALARNGA